MAQGQGNGGDDSVGYFLIAATVIVAPMIAWKFIHTAVADATVATLIVEMNNIPGLWWDADTVIGFLRRVPTATMNWLQVHTLMNVAARPLVVPGILFLGYMGYRLKRHDYATQYRRVLGMEDLMAEQSKTYKSIQPIIRDNPVNDRTGRWDEALTPEQWMQLQGIDCAAHAETLGAVGSLLALGNVTFKDLESIFVINGFDHKSRLVDLLTIEETARRLNEKSPHILNPDMEVSVDKMIEIVRLVWIVMAEARLQVTSGEQWNFDVDDLSWYQKGLMASFILKGSHLRDESLKLTYAMAELWATEVVPYRFDDKVKKWVPIDESLEVSPRDAKELQQARSGVERQIVHIAQRQARQKRLQTKFNAAIEKSGTVRTMIDAVFNGNERAIVINPSSRVSKEALEYIAENGGIMDEPKKIMNRHAYVNTGLTSLFKWAKLNGGVTPSGEFNWLRGCDRQLWYILNSEGRNVPHIESAGLFAHWQTENVYGDSRKEPSIHEAVRGIFDYFTEKSAT